jgi:hypothetical protein
MRQALARHDALAAAIIDQYDGLVVKQRGEGDRYLLNKSR